MSLGYSNPKSGYLSRKQDIDAAIQEVLESGQYIFGPVVSDFEDRFASFVGARAAVAVANGTDALALALVACDVGPEDEVITVAHTAVATAAAIRLAGAVPVFVDTEPGYYTLDPQALENALTPRTKAIVVVHLFGQAADMDPILAFARNHGLRVIEDCAQAHGARYKGHCAGTMGDMGCFSFYPTKNLGGFGDGGAVVTDQADLADRVRRLREYGWDENRISLEVGRNSRLDPIQAAILRVQLKHLDRDNARRAEIAGHYNAAFENLELDLPKVRPECHHVYHLYVVATDMRDPLAAHLRTHDILAGIHYPVPVHRQPAYADDSRAPLPVTEREAGRILSLPMYPALAEQDLEHVVQAVASYFGG